MRANGNQLLKVEEVAEQLRVTPYTVRKWLRDGKLKGKNMGGAGWRVETSEVERFIAGEPAPQGESGGEG